MRAFSFIALPLLLAVACAEDTPVPDYPFPPQPPVAERPELAEYVGAEDPLDAEPVEEEWDDGLSDEDLMLPEDGAEAEGGAADDEDGAADDEDSEE